jgi:hypothetical protein
MCLHRCFSLLFFCPFFNVIKPINSAVHLLDNKSSDESFQLGAAAVQLLNNNSSHESFQLGEAGMGKSDCEQSVLFTCNMGTDDSSTSTCITAH